MPSTVNEIQSGRTPDSKRGSKMSSNQSLNHLLNFTLPPRQSYPSLPRRSNKKFNAKPAYGVRSTERFVNAQYRFMMNPLGDYTVHFADPDIFFQWHDIQQVIIPRTSPIVDGERYGESLTTCPICLSPPTAPRMTRCGHVFCFSCILHYLNTSDVNKWIRCPICFDSVSETQLKSVKWFDGHLSDSAGGDARSVGFSSSSKSRKTLRMRLMQRPQITTLALPRSSTWPSDVLSPHQAPFHFLPDVFAFSKFMLATPSYLIAELERDLDELREERSTLDGLHDELGILFINAAERKVHFQIERAKEMDTEQLQSAVDKAQGDLADIQGREAMIKEALNKDMQALRLREDIPKELLSVKAIGSQDSVSRPSRPRRNLNPPPPSTSTYYYYQSAVGTPIFLHPLDIRILLSHFNTYPSFPNDIELEVEAFSEGAVNNDLRKRCKYLALPEGADVVFIEADLESVVGADTLKNFEGALKTRRAKRKEKLRKDDRAKMRAEEKEKERAYGNALLYSGHIGLDSSVKIHDDWSSSQPSVNTESANFPTTPSQQPGGAWGSRSFASALHASPSAQSLPVRQSRENDIEDEWDVDSAWHEIEQRGEGRKKGRNQKMVVLGGGPGGARRR